MKSNILEQKLKVINIGLELFYETLKQQGVEVVHVDWQPPAGGDLGILALLEKVEEINTRKA